MAFKQEWLVDMTERVSQRLLQAKHPLIEEDILDLLENNIQYAFPIVDSLVTHSNPFEETITLEQQSCLLLLCEILVFVNFAIEQGHEWAEEFSQDFQYYLAEHAFTPEVDGAIIQNILDILHQTETEVTDVIRVANSRLLEQSCDSIDEFEPCKISELLEEIAKIGAGNEYELYDHLVSQTYQIIPIEVQMIMITEMLQATSAIIRETVVLMLLHPEPMLREHAATLLLQFPQTLSPTGLRRLIVLRNWLPTDERPAVDVLIRTARKLGTDCASWPEASIVKIMATGFDGVGAQSILVLTKQYARYHLAGLLLKEKIGVREPLLFRAKRKNESEKIIKEMSADSSCIPVSIQYLDIALPHFLAIGLEQGHPPSPLLLSFAEIVGASHWRAEYINEESALRHLVTDLGDNTADNKNIINKAFVKSKTWLEQQDFAESWFEQDAEVDKMLEHILQEVQTDLPLGIDEVVDEVCCRILEPRRIKWRDRLLWMALWAKANTRKRGPSWQEFVIIAQAISDGAPLEDIPLMHAISTETVLIATRDIFTS